MEPRDRNRPTILIIGGGFSGAMVAIHLLRSKYPLEILLADKNGSSGRGVAYAPDSSRALLNVPAASMSAFADDPEHFLRWARSKDCSVDAAEFLAREVYGNYLEETLAAAVAANPNAIFTLISDEVIDLKTSNSEEVGTSVRAILKSGRSINAAAAVLALGNFPPSAIPGSDSAVEAHPAYSGNPWSINWDNQFERIKSLVLVGTGLSAVDIIIEAFARGYRGKIAAISTLGLLPQPHKPGLPNHAASALVGSKRSLRELVRTIRALADEKITSGSYWQEVMDDVRPHVQQIWRVLSRHEQRTFMRHLRPYWDVHRHRIAPQISKIITDAVALKKLEIHRAKVLKLSLCAEQIEITYRPRSQADSCVMYADHVVNCTGPRIGITQIESALLQSLLRRGYATPDELGIGLICTQYGELVNNDGSVEERLFTIGSTRRGEHWETIAVRELRVQAKEVAAVVLKKAQSDQQSPPRLKAANA